MYSLERRGKRGELMQDIKIVRSLAEIRGHYGALFQKKGNKTPKGKAKAVLLERVNTAPGSSFFAFGVLNG